MHPLCPDICPPSRHDRQRLALYATHFHPNILGVTGTPDQVAKAAQRYGIVFRRVDQGDSSLGYRVDPEGRWVQTFPHATPATAILSFNRGLLASR
ncbi:MAG: SCO family protein [Chromatiaceae bacterium]